MEKLFNHLIHMEGRIIRLLQRLKYLSEISGKKYLHPSGSKPAIIYDLKQKHNAGPSCIRMAHHLFTQFYKQ